jgi:hypothetical protein
MPIYPQSLLSVNRPVEIFSMLATLLSSFAESPPLHFKMSQPFADLSNVSRENGSSRKSKTEKELLQWKALGNEAVAQLEGAHARYDKAISAIYIH